MPSTRDIRRRIRSVKNTQQITKAMQMVASSKMRKAQLAALAGRPYAILMNQVVVDASRDIQDFRHPLMEIREIRKRGVLAVSTDKGLCGALNANMGREVMKFDKSTIYVAAGRKGAQFLARTKRNLVAEFTYKDAPQFAEARAISKMLQQMFLKGEVDCVDVIFTRFINTLTQKVEVRRLLPVGELANLLNLPGGAQEKALPGPAESEKGRVEHIFEPSAEQVLGGILPHFINFIVYQILLEAKASEHSARMVAMKNATDNAKQLIKDLTLEYNKMRQANITKELLEITTAQMALGN
jgi:F-type H+-transporting ATPase subunit gamma